MKFKNIKFFKIIISILLAINITTSSTYALFGAGDIVFDPANTAQSILNVAQTTATRIFSGQISFATISSALSNNFLMIKEKLLDKIAFTIANSAIASIKGDLVKAISGGGIDGGSAFLDNPEQFFKNIAKDQEKLIVKELLGTEGGILYAQNKDIFKLFSQGVNNEKDQITAAFKESVTSNIGSTICNKLSTELQNAKSISDNQVGISIIQASYDASCKSGGDKATQYQNQKDCAKEFSCGGFDSILAITQNLGKNTDAGRYEALLTKYQKDVAKETDVVNKELDRSGGFLNKKECKPGETVDGICTEYITLSPGVAAANSLQKLITSPIDENLRVDELGELVSSLANRFLTNLINKGINKGITAIKDGISNEIASLRDDNSTTPGSSGPGNTGTPNTNPLNTNGPGTGTNNTTPDPSEIPPAADPAYELGSNGTREYLLSIKPILESLAKENTDSRALVQKELSAHVSVLNAYKQVDECYIRKDKERIIPGSTALPYPQSVPSVIGIRILDLSSKARNLQGIISLSQGVDTYISEKFLAMSTSTNYNVLDFYRNKITNKLESSASLKNSDWGIRDSNNTYGVDGSQVGALYTLLADEAVKTLKNEITTGFGENAKSEDISPLAVCNAFDPNPQLKPVETNNNNN